MELNANYPLLPKYQLWIYYINSTEIKMFSTAFKHFPGTISRRTEELQREGDRRWVLPHVIKLSLLRQRPCRLDETSQWPYSPRGKWGWWWRPKFRRKLTNISSKYFFLRDLGIFQRWSFYFCFSGCWWSSVVDVTGHAQNSVHNSSGRSLERAV